MSIIFVSPTVGTEQINEEIKRHNLCRVFDTESLRTFMEQKKMTLVDALKTTVETALKKQESLMITGKDITRELASQVADEYTWLDESER